MATTTLKSVTTGTFKISNAYLALLKVILGSKYDTQMAEWFEDFLRYLKSKKVVKVDSRSYSGHNFSKTYRISPKVALKFKAWVYQEQVGGITCVLQGFAGNTKITVDEMHRMSETHLIEDSLLKEDSDDEQVG